MCISQDPKVIKNRNWYQMIAITIFYNYTISYINKLTLVAQILKGTLDIGEKKLANEGGIQIKLLISQ